MQLFKCTTDKTVKRLRWVMVCVILFDILNTLLGQPSSYWQHPETAREGNYLFRFIMTQGYVFDCIFKLTFMAVAFLLASLLPKRPGLVVIFSFILCHYYGASTWLKGHWHFGAKGPIIYGIVLGVILVLSAFPSEAKPDCVSHPHKPDDGMLNDESAR
jgi:hypothetical protein